MKRALTLALACAVAAPAGAVELSFPAKATPVAQRAAPSDSYFVATQPYSEGTIDGVTAEGAIDRRSWRVGSGGLTTMQILAPLRSQLQAAGFEVLFECADLDCGGFDFRFNIDVLPEPDMHVNLGDFRYLSARRDPKDAPAEYVTLIVSRSANSGFVQLTRIGKAEAAREITTSTKAPPPDTSLAEAGPLIQRLEGSGSATLDDLEFKTGSSELGDGQFGSLEKLAAYLADRPNRTVMLVGHTDAVGALDNNIALSKRRARSVAQRLIDTHGVNPAQISAEGVGFLAPRATNLTDEGRAANRRVEVVLTSTE